MDRRICETEIYDSYQWDLSQFLSSEWLCFCRPLIGKTLRPMASGCTSGVINVLGESHGIKTYKSSHSVNKYISIITRAKPWIPLQHICEKDITWFLQSLLPSG